MLACALLGKALLKGPRGGQEVTSVRKGCWEGSGGSRGEVRACPEQPSDSIPSSAAPSASFAELGARC